MSDCFQPVRKQGVSRRRSSRFAWLIVLAVLAVASGCSTGYLNVRSVPLNPLADPLQLFSRKGPQPSPRTAQLLRRYDMTRLQEEEPEKVMLKLQSEAIAEPILKKVYAIAELAYINGRRAEANDDEQAALDMYSQAIAQASLYLFDPSMDRFRNAYDPQFRSACELYNVALEAALRIIDEQGNLRPAQHSLVQVGSYQYEISVAAVGSWRADEIERLEFVSDYDLEGLTNRHHQYGLGVPLIAVRRAGARNDAAEQFYPPGLSFPVTAFLHVIPARSQSGERPGPPRFVLELRDSIVDSSVNVAGRQVPLERDLTTPLAYFLDNPDFQESKKLATRGLLNPNATQAYAGLYMLEPYDADKIPVLLVHGLWSSPLTWAEMFNDLRSFPEIRERYQFWFYLYPTGQPFWITAKQMREELARTKHALDPLGQSTRLNEMVVVGHSMGGLVARLQTIESGNDFWSIVSDRPLEELKASPEERNELASTLFFRPNPAIRRVVTIGTPHRGSEFANGYTRWLGRRLISLPEVVVNMTNRTTRENPGFFRDTQLLTTTTSIDSLAPDSPILPVMLRARQAPWVAHHNVVGLVPDEGIVGRFHAGSDGFVTFESAHLENAATETIVPSDHTRIHQHPRAILAVRDILSTHFQQMANESMQRRQNPHSRASHVEPRP